MRVIVLAAGMGKRLENRIGSPKCLIEIDGETLLERYLKILQHFGLWDIVLVVGYEHIQIIDKLKKTKFKCLKENLRTIYNGNYEKGSILSLYQARGELDGDILIMDGDMYFEPALVKTIVNSSKKNFFLVDRTAQYDNEAVFLGFSNGKAADLARGLRGNYDILGEWAGCLRLSQIGSYMLKKLILEKVSEGQQEAGYEFIIPELFDKFPISYELVDGIKWVEIDFMDDIERAKRLDIERLKNE